MSNLPPGVTDRMIENAYGDQEEGDAITALLEEQSVEVDALARAMYGDLDDYGFEALDEALDEAQRVYDELVKLGMDVTRGQEQKR